MPWILVFLVISACLIQDIQTAPKSNVPVNEQDFGSDNPRNLCEQCQIIELAIIWANFSTDIAVASLKEQCRDIFTFFSGFCALIDGKESEFVKSAFDCSGVKFKDDDKVLPNCTVPGSDDDRGRMTKVCESYVESCKVDQLHHLSKV
ncbi:hypothetical protein Ddc_15666 [Ditylenchus destructor]|nr:hypothetical protein Ddc_15666 [Ditylenchus destructor]